MTSARVFAVLSVALTTILLSGSNAMAATPATWDDPEPISNLALLGIVVAAPLGLFVIITALVAIVNRKAHHHVVVPPSSDLDTVQH